MNAKHEVFKHHNSIIELSKMISDMAWRDVSRDDPFTMNASTIAALADSIQEAANAALETTQIGLTNMADDEDQPDKTKGENHEHRRFRPIGA